MSLKIYKSANIFAIDAKMGEKNKLRLPKRLFPGALKIYCQNMSAVTLTVRTTGKCLDTARL